MQQQSVDWMQCWMENCILICSYVLVYRHHHHHDHYHSNPKLVRLHFETLYNFHVVVFWFCVVVFFGSMCFNFMSVCGFCSYNVSRTWKRNGENHICGYTLGNSYTRMNVHNFSSSWFVTMKSCQLYLPLICQRELV